MRIQVIDVIKAISITMIVNVHLIGGPLFFIGDTYHVIAFFFVSGIVSAVGHKWAEVTFAQFAYQRALRLIYPYITLSICYILFRMGINYIRDELLFDNVVNNAIFDTITFRGVGTLWFFPILYIGELLFYIIRKSNMKSIYILLCGICSIILASVLNANKVCGPEWYGSYAFYSVLVNNPLSILFASIIAVFFMEIGYLFFKYKPNLFIGDFVFTRCKLVNLILVCIASFIVNLLLIDQYSGDLHKLDIGQPFIYLVCSISGLSFVTSLSILICKLSRKLASILSLWGRNSIIIMTTHSQFMLNSIAYWIVCASLNKFDIVGEPKMICLLSLFIIVIAEVFIIKVVNATFLKYIYKLPFQKKTTSI